MDSDMSQEDLKKFVGELQQRLNKTCVFHRFTYPKGIHSYRYFLQPMRTPYSMPPVHVYSPILSLATHAYMQLDLYCIHHDVRIECLHFSGKMHILSSSKATHPGLAENIAPDGGPGSDITWIEIIIQTNLAPSYCLHCKKWHFEPSRYIYVQLYK